MPAEKKTAINWGTVMDDERVFGHFRIGEVLHVYTYYTGRDHCNEVNGTCGQDETPCNMVAPEIEPGSVG